MTAGTDAGMLRGLVAAVIVLAPLSASAANGLRPRTPALFEATPCMMTVDAGSVVHFDYGVPYDDTELTPDELTDSRKMQFFAFRELRFDYQLPTYISRDDHDRAEANGDNTRAYSDEDILEVASAWPSSIWTAITGADERAAITAEQAAMGFDWDTAGVEPGAWVVAAYTWEPENNLWSYRMGAVRVVDPAAPDAAGPAGFFAVSPDAPAAEVGAGYPMAACIDAAAGSTYTASYGILEGVDEPTWVPFVEGQVAPDGEFELEVTAPPEANGSSIKVRLEITDPAGQSYVAYSPYPVLVLGGSANDDGDETDATETDGDDGNASADDDAGGCRSAGSPSAWTFGTLALLMLGMSRRRAVRYDRPS